MNQREIVEKRISEVGYVDNFWAMQNYILRLGAIMCQLKKSGVRFSGDYGKALGKDKEFWKNYYYTIDKTPVGLMPSEFRVGKSQKKLLNH